jgi:Holliday junction resolvasome RuvABC endonuclease subunit
MGNRKQLRNSIIAIDVGTKFSGLVAGPEDFLITTIMADKGDLAEMRLMKIAHKIIKIVEKRKPDYIVLEDYAMGRVFNVEVAELMGMLKMMLKEKFEGKLIFGVMNPSMIRAILCGDGRSSEQQIKEAVKEVYGDIYKTIHEVDALAIYHIFNKYLDGELDERRMRLIRSRVYEL